MAKVNREWPEVNEYFPCLREFHKLPRQYVVNTIYTLIGNNFRLWVAQQIKDRCEAIENKKDMMISMDPTIAKAFEESVMISTSKGTGAQMLTQSKKRRRNKAEMEEAREEEEFRREAIETKAKKIKDLEDQLQQQEIMLDTFNREVTESK